MLTADQARSLALRLPDAVERDHHGRPSFRVGTRIFATLRDDGEHMNVLVDEAGIKTAVLSDSETFSEVWWGKRLAAVRVDLRRIDEDRLGSLLADAWEHERGT